nr:hypothetical protein [Moritella viscosa]
MKLKEEHNAFKKSINYAKSILSEWIKSVRSNQKYELEKRAARSAKVIIDMSVKLPRVADRLVIIASNEEQLLQDLKDESKVTYQLEKIKEKTKKRRTRTRSKN